MDVVVPDLGDFSDVEVVEIIVRPGDVVQAESPLITLETDKAAMDVPAPVAGKIVALKVERGDRVSAGDAIAVMEPQSETVEIPAMRADVVGERARAAHGADGPDERTQTGDATFVIGTATEILKQAPGRRPVSVPDLGDFADVEVIELLVAPGDAVEANQGLITLETDKAAMDVPAPFEGIVAELKVGVGDRVSTGDEIAVMLASDPEAPEAVPAAAAATPVRDSSAPRAAEAEPVDTPVARADAAAPRQGSARSAAEAHGAVRPAGQQAASAVTASALPNTRALPAAVAPRIDETLFSRAHASPSVRKLARELGVDLGRVRGSGRKNRVTAADVKAYVKEVLFGAASAAPAPALPRVPEVDFAAFGEIERRPLTRIQKISGPRLHASWVNIPHVTQNDLADITELEARRQQLKEAALAQGARLTPLAFIMRACVIALAEFPTFKCSLAPDGESLVYKHYTHLGFAADTPNGLVVPVIRDADKKNLLDIARELGELSGAAREGKLRAAQMQGGVFTISSLGGIGGTYFTPIINAPEVAILGVSRTQYLPMFMNARFVARLMLPLSLSYDHRVIDGAQAVRFTTRLGELLGDANLLLQGVDL